MTAPCLAIVWHSRTGAAQAMAAAAAQGAMAAAAEADDSDGSGDGSARVWLLAAAEATPERLAAAAGYLFVCPENLGTMSGAMKEMFDRAYYPLLGQVEGRPYATAIAAGSDGRGAETQIDRIVTGWRLRRVAEPVIIGLDAQSEAAILAPKSVPAAGLERCSALGEALSAGLAMRIF